MLFRSLPVHDEIVLRMGIVTSPHVREDVPGLGINHEGSPLQVTRNLPRRGTEVVMPGVMVIRQRFDAIELLPQAALRPYLQIEINRSIYMEEESYRRGDRFAEIQRHLSGLAGRRPRCARHRAR